MPRHVPSVSWFVSLLFRFTRARLECLCHSVLHGWSSDDALWRDPPLLIPSSEAFLGSRCSGILLSRPWTGLGEHFDSTPSSRYVPARFPVVCQVLNEDIYLLKQIRVTLDATKISIVDARSLLNAKANQVSLAPCGSIDAWRT